MNENFVPGRVWEILKMEKEWHDIKKWMFVNTIKFTRIQNGVRMDGEGGGARGGEDGRKASELNKLSSLYLTPEN